MTDQSGGDDPLTVAGWTRGPNGELIPPTTMPNFGANRTASVGPNGVPMPGQGIMPGGGVLNRMGATPGALSMGYPGLGTNSMPPPGGGGMWDAIRRGAGAVGNALNPINSANAQEMPPLVQPKLGGGGQVPTPIAPLSAGNVPPAAPGAVNNINSALNDSLTARHTPSAGWGNFGGVFNTGVGLNGNQPPVAPFHPGKAGVGPATGGTPVQRFVNDAFGSGAAGLSVDPRDDAYGSGGFMVNQPLGRAPAARATPMRQPYIAPAPRAPSQINLGYGQQPDSPFTMVLRPNAPAEGGGRRGGNSGGPPLTTALDLSGYRPNQPMAPWTPPPSPLRRPNWNNFGLGLQVLGQNF